jgi:hypothetical protein
VLHVFKYPSFHVIFQVLTAAIMKFRTVFWDVLPCKKLSTDVSDVRAAFIIRDETSVDYYFTRQYIPEDNSEP